MKQKYTPVQDVTVIGAGPAGSAAAIYAARKGLLVTLLTEQIGGQARDAAFLDSLISVQKQRGLQLAADLESRIAENNITLKQHVQVQRIGLGANKELHLSTGEVVLSKSVIVATGAHWRKLGVPGESENIGKGVSFCAHCHGPNFINKPVVVIGADNKALQSALELASTASAVSLVAKTSKWSADQSLIDQIQQQSNISTHLSTTVTGVVASHEKVVAIEYQKPNSHKLETLHAEGVFVQIGSTPNSQFLQGTLELNAQGEVLIDQRCQTSEPGIYACGDVSDVPYKQVVIAMGEGAKAALAASEYLSRRR